MNKLKRALSVLLAVALGSVALSATAADRSHTAHVATMSNAVESNEIVLFSHSRTEGLVKAGTFATGGIGSGGGLGNQSGLLVSDDRLWLFAVNAGSDTISSFAVTNDGLTLIGTVDSGGGQPISVTQYGRLLYVLNAGSDSIAGFSIADDGSLAPLAGSVQSLSAAAAGPAQISFTPVGDALVVTEKSTNMISVFQLNGEGVAGAALASPSEGATPFGFSFDRFGNLLVTEAEGGAADASTVSSYDIASDGSLTVLDSSAATTESAACWLVTSRNGRVAFTTNTESSTISAFRVFRDGQLRLVNDDGVAANTGESSRPIDMALSENGRFLFALSAATGEITGYRVAGARLFPVPGVTGLPSSVNGLATF